MPSDTLFAVASSRDDCFIRLRQLTSSFYNTCTQLWASTTHVISCKPEKGSELQFKSFWVAYLLKKKMLVLLRLCEHWLVVVALFTYLLQSNSKKYNHNVSSFSSVIWFLLKKASRSLLGGLKWESTTLNLMKPFGNFLFPRSPSLAPFPSPGWAA